MTEAIYEEYHEENGFRLPRIEEKSDFHNGSFSDQEFFQRNFEEETNPKRKLSYSALNLTEDIDESDVGNFVGIDFGGTLTKVVFFQPDELPETAKTITDFVFSASKYGTTGERDMHLSFKSRRLKGTFHFIRFQTSRTIGAMKMFTGKQVNIRVVQGTGGGAVKYKKLIKETLGIDIKVHDEFKTLVKGLTLTLLEHPDTECYTYMDYLSNVQENPSETGLKRIRQRSGSTEVDVVKVCRPISSLFPYLIVNIGSGVSMLKVESATKFERISGTALGGATFLGLCKLITRCKDFDSAMRLAEEGDDRNLNLLVEDIYGGPLVLPLSSKKNTSTVSLPAQSLKEKLQGRRRGSLQTFERGSSLVSKTFTLKGSHVASFFGKLCRVDSIQMQEKDEDGSNKFVFFGVGPVDGILLLIITLLCSIIGWFIQESAPLLLCTTIFPFLVTVFVLKLKPKEEVSVVEEETAVVDPKDVANALVAMISQNITQIAFLNAKMHNVKRVIFTGSFMRGNDLAEITLARNIKIWSSGEMSALFMEHEGYFGALGSFLSSRENKSKL